jgi:hypothetical protein
MLHACVSMLMRTRKHAPVDVCAWMCVISVCAVVVVVIVVVRGGGGTPIAGW